MKQPCIECPFKRTSTPGYLGELSGNPVAFLNCIEYEPNLCHLSVEGNADVSVGVKSRLCVGHLQFLCNSFKLPIDKEWRVARDAAGKNENVFAFKKEFIDHHKM